MKISDLRQFLEFLDENGQTISKYVPDEEIRHYLDTKAIKRRRALGVKD